MSHNEPTRTPRREFLRQSAIQSAGLAGGLSLVRSVHAAESDTIRLALIGCGGRGAGAAVQALNASPRARLVAMADAFSDQLQRRLEAIRKIHGDRVDVPSERQFVGMDSCFYHESSCRFFKNLSEF